MLEILFWRTLTSFGMGVFLAAAISPVLRLMVPSIRWRKAFLLSIKGFVPALLGVSLTYMYFVDLSGRQPHETPGFLILGWIVIGAYLVAKQLQMEDSTVKVGPIVGTILLSLLVLSFVFVGAALVIAG